MHDRLTPLQRELLRAFVRRAPGFYLSGGAALAGFHLGHRTTEDLDLFTAGPTLEEGRAALEAAAADTGSTLEPLISSPLHIRVLAGRGGESLVVDLISDPTPQGTAAKQLLDGVRVDPPEEILANKLCTLLSRSEIRDIVDVMALERAGYPVEDALPLAQRKDTGLTPAQLAWVLSQIRIGPDARVPAGFSIEETRHFIAALVDRLALYARPAG